MRSSSGSFGTICGVVHRYDLGRRRNVLEQAENVGIEYLDIDVELPRVGEDDMLGKGMSSESPEPLAGRLGAPAQRRHRV
jgi:hypothetical protein